MFVVEGKSVDQLATGPSHENSYMLSAVIMILRTCALYGRSRRLLVLLLSVLVVELAVGSVSPCWNLHLSGRITVRSGL